MRVIKSSPPGLTELLFDLGSRTLVLVEGDDDCDVFEEWYAEHLGDIVFYASSGNQNVQALMSEVAQYVPKRKVYGIIDRDFRSDEDVEASRKSTSRLFILRRYAIENYLLEPAAIREQLRLYYGRKRNAPDVRQIEQDLLNLCQQLHTRMAANWVLLDSGRKYFPEGHDVHGRQALIQQAAMRLGCDETEAEKRIAAKESLLAPKLATLEEAHTCTSGKHLLHQAHLHYIKIKFDRKHLCNLLADTIKRQGVHPDIKAIVEERILRRSEKTT